MVQTITALPLSSGNGSRSLQLQIEYSALLPNVKPGIVSATPSQVDLSAYAHDLKHLDAAELRRRRDKIREMDKTRIMTIPFRRFSFAIWKGFTAMKRLWVSEGFILLSIKGHNGTWKLNRNVAWLLEDGKALDRLVKHSSS